MKKKLLAASFMGITLLANAQFSEGQKVLSGSFAFTNSNNANGIYSSNEVNQTSFYFSPSFARFKNPTTLIGYKITFATNNYIDKATSNKTTNTSIGGGYFVQKIKPIGKDFFVFAETGINATYDWSKYSNFTSPSFNLKGKSFGATAYITPGLGYKITPRWIADITLNNIAALSYSHGQNDYFDNSTSTVRSNQKTDAVRFYTGLDKNALSNIGIGIRWLLK